MDFTTNNSRFLFIHNDKHTNKNNTMSVKKVVSLLVSKLPSHQTLRKSHKVAPTVPTTSKPASNKHSAIKKEDDIYKNLRQYYSNTNNKTSIPNELPTIQQKKRELSHKIVKQYQQTNNTNTHWVEHSNHTNNHFKNIPMTFKSHDYVRDKRSNPNHLRIKAIQNNIKDYKKKENPVLNKKRKDSFVWGNPSKLRDISI